MQRSRALLVLALAAAAGLSALLVVLLFGGLVDRGSDDAALEITADGQVEPRVSLFGDTVTATVVVTLNPRTVDLDSVRVTGSFLPFRPAGEPTRIVRSAGDTSAVETTFTLRCVSSACVPGTSTMEAEPKPARVAYEAREGGPEPVLEVPLPKLVVYTRIDPRAVSGRDPLAAPWRANLVTLPTVSYRVRPWLLVGLLLATGGLLVLAGGALAYRMLPRPAPPPEPEPPPGPEVSALERALALLESPSQVDGVADRRRALELIADEATRWEARDLTQVARALAWSEEAPEANVVRSLVARVRAHLEEAAEGGGEGDGGLA